jgi:multimeric flavodoxin WrbA
MNLKAVILNCALKRSPEISNTRALIDKAVKLFHEQGVETEVIRVVDYNILFGVSSDEGEDDEWPEILKNREPSQGTSDSHELETALRRGKRRKQI